MKKSKPAIEHLMVNMKDLVDSATPLQPPEDVSKTPKIAYRKLAMLHYRRPATDAHFNVCVVCGFGVQSVLEVAHLSQNRKDNSIENLAILCPNCHKMHDIGLLPTEVVRKLRDEHRIENWGLRIKDAGTKAAASRKAKAVRAAKSAAAKKAWSTRASPKTAD